MASEMLSNDIFIVGAGTYGEAMYELAEQLGYTIAGFFDEDENKAGQAVMDSLVLGKFSTLPTKYMKNRKFIIAIGNNDIRKSLMDFIVENGGETPTLIHPTAVISPSAKVGKGVYIHGNTYIWTKAIIKDFTIISPNVVIAHHTTIEAGCLISTQSSVGASVQIGEKVFIGMGATIVTGVSKIDSHTTVGAGAVVLENLDSHSVYVGVPAKKIKRTVKL